jgi:hypothetical protein
MLTVGQNSWATILEADVLLTDRLNATAWFELGDVADPGELSKSTLLVTAFHWLSSSPQLSLSPSLTDGVVKFAQVEAAFFLLEHYEELNERRAALFTGVDEFELSKKREKLNLSNLQIPDFIIGALSDYAGTENTTAQLLGEYDA